MMLPIATEKRHSELPVQGNFLQRKSRLSAPLRFYSQTIFKLLNGAQSVSARNPAQGQAVRMKSSNQVER